MIHADKRLLRQPSKRSRGFNSHTQGGWKSWTTCDRDHIKGIHPFFPKRLCQQGHGFWDMRPRSHFWNNSSILLMDRDLRRNQMSDHFYLFRLPGTVPHRNQRNSCFITARFDGEHSDRLHTRQSSKDLRIDQESSKNELRPRTERQFGGTRQAAYPTRSSSRMRWTSAILERSRPPGEKSLSTSLSIRIMISVRRRRSEAARS